MVVFVSKKLYQWRRNHGVSGRWHPRENCHQQGVSFTTCSFITPTSIALSCSARTEVLSCSAGTDGKETDIFFCQQTSTVRGECFFLFRSKSIFIENSDVCQWLVLVSFIQNHSTITQLFYVTTNSNLKLLVHDLLCSEMLRELLLHRAEN